jgi:hypothetical protein
MSAHGIKAVCLESLVLLDDEVAARKRKDESDEAEVRN